MQNLALRMVLIYDSLLLAWGLNGLVGWIKGILEGLEFLAHGERKIKREGGEKLFIRLFCFLSVVSLLICCKTKEACGSNAVSEKITGSVFDRLSSTASNYLIVSCSCNYAMRFVNM